MSLRVAIVDDEPIVCKRLSQALAKEGYAVEAFMRVSEHAYHHPHAAFAA